MLKRLAARNRHRRLMSTAVSVASLHTNPTPQRVADLAFARHHLTVDPDEANTYLNAAHAYLGHTTNT